jgi:hypothetical protein
MIHGLENRLALKPADYRMGMGLNLPSGEGFYPSDNIDEFPQELPIRSFFRNPVRVFTSNGLL